jgi:hypothetical protein
MAKIKKAVKEAVKQVVDKTSDNRIYTTKIGPVDVGSGFSKSINPDEIDKPFLYLGKRNQEDDTYGYAKIGAGKDKQIGFGKLFNEGQGSLGVDVGKDFIGIGGSYNFRKGGIAKGCGKVLKDRKKVTKYY